MIRMRLVYGIVGISAVAAASTWAAIRTGEQPATERAHVEVREVGAVGQRPTADADPERTRIPPNVNAAGPETEPEPEFDAATLAMMAETGLTPEAVRQGRKMLNNDSWREYNSPDQQAERKKAVVQKLRDRLDGEDEDRAWQHELTEQFSHAAEAFPNFGELELAEVKCGETVCELGFDSDGTLDRRLSMLLSSAGSAIGVQALPYQEDETSDIHLFVSRPGRRLLEGTNP